MSFECIEFECITFCQFYKQFIQWLSKVLIKYYIKFHIKNKGAKQIDKP